MPHATRRQRWLKAWLATTMGRCQHTHGVLNAVSNVEHRGNAQLWNWTLEAFWNASNAALRCVTVQRFERHVKKHRKRHGAGRR